MGHVRVIKLTDDQWAGMYRYYGPETIPTESTPTQLILFHDEENEPANDNGPF